MKVGGVYMIYNIRGDKILVTDAIKDYVEKRLERLEKFEGKNRRS